MRRAAAAVRRAAAAVRVGDIGAAAVRAAKRC